MNSNSYWQAKERKEMDLTTAHDGSRASLSLSQCCISEPLPLDRKRKALDNLEECPDLEATASDEEPEEDLDEDSNDAQTIGELVTMVDHLLWPKYSQRIKDIVKDQMNQPLPEASLPSWNTYLQNRHAPMKEYSGDFEKEYNFQGIPLNFKPFDPDYYGQTKPVQNTWDALPASERARINKQPCKAVNIGGKRIL